MWKRNIVFFDKKSYYVKKMIKTIEPQKAFGERMRNDLREMQLKELEVLKEFLRIVLQID